LIGYKIITLPSGGLKKPTYKTIHQMALQSTDDQFCHRNDSLRKKQTSANHHVWGFVMYELPVWVFSIDVTTCTVLAMSRINLVWDISSKLLPPG